MALKKELKDAYKEAGVTDDQIAKLEEVFTDEEILSKLTAQHMKAADYTTKTQALADARKALEKEREEFTQGRDYLDGQMNTYKADMEKRLNDALAQVSESSLRGAALETKLRTIAAQYGEDPAELLSDVKATREEKKDAPVYDEYDKRYISRDDFTKQADSVVSFTTQIRDFEREYKKQFGTEYDGSITDLVGEASKEVAQRRARGQNIDLFGYMREKLDFSGQARRNQETEKTKAAEERTKWETQTREEIERDVRSKVLAENPAAYKGSWAPKPEAWRNELGAAARQNKLPDQSPMAQHNHRAGLHAKFEELAAKAEASNAA